MELLENYAKALQAIYDHVGLKEDWVICPIDDNTEMFWDCDSEEVKYAKTKEDFEEGDEIYIDEIYKQRFYEKHVYEGELITLIFTNPRVDGMKWWSIFDNSKRIKD